MKREPSPFTIVPESLENVRKTSLRHIPSFSIKGHLDSVVCNIHEPLTGEVVIEACSATIRSVELQLVRVETCGYADGMAREATEIQNIQITDGAICHGWPIPIHMIFPRLFTCPTVNTRTFKVRCPRGAGELPTPTPYPTPPSPSPLPLYLAQSRPISQVDFEVNLVILFSDGHLLTENFPLMIVRAPPTPKTEAASSA